MQRTFLQTATIFTALAVIGGLLAFTGIDGRMKESEKLTTNETDKKIKLPLGFSATVLATDLGPTRHIAVGKSGDIYVKLSKLKDGKGIYILRDANNDGVIDETRMFGNYPGTGIYIKDGYLYSSSNTGVFSYELKVK